MDVQGVPPDALPGSLARRIPVGVKNDAMGLNLDYAETFLEAAGLPKPADMQGRSLLPVFKGQTPADWRMSMYYRYYHDPGHHNTRAHYGVRTMTHKLIYFWTKISGKLYNLVRRSQRAPQPVWPCRARRPSPRPSRPNSLD